ncbi:hypothetical protein KORDIASMS9_01599 [Kordia sp. SMS9]|uniref:hypothetical protein n=1 Tax=Kordia sp. SMS9 TaxID=2282170 RepID=UPI000E0D1AFE|nr:hypothetical protein [Kordia sp. SMS9]AXG69379.1 hypothetical protein KORDIASMS9_01599 [Kordia sp. SMS9]
MEKRYYSQLAYFIKAILIIIVLGVFFYIITELSDQIAETLSIKFRKNLVAIEYVMNIVFGIICLLFILIILLRGKPQITINETMIRTNRFKKKFEELASYHPGKGGSEPFVLSKEGKQYDIELSWFSKKDRKEIEAFLTERIQTA